MITYVDTSTLIKLLIDEPGSARAQLIWDTAETLATVGLTIVEARATLAAATRAARLTSVQHASAVADLGLLWSSLNIVEVTADLVDRASEVAATHALRGHDAVHLTAALLAGAELLTSADGRRCAAAEAEGIHVLNPMDEEPGAPVAEPTDELERVAHGVINPLADKMTGDSGVHGIPTPANAEPDPNRSGFVLAANVGTIQDLVAFYRDWMSVDGWIFDAEHGADDPYEMEQRRLGGYFVQLYFVKPTSPPTTVGITVGNSDGRPGHKQAITIHIGRTPDDDLPRRSRQLGPDYS
jgi:uncharacterized protein